MLKKVNKPDFIVAEERANPDRAVYMKLFFLRYQFSETARLRFKGSEKFAALYLIAACDELFECFYNLFDFETGVAKTGFLLHSTGLSEDARKVLTLAFDFYTRDDPDYCDPNVAYGCGRGRKNVNTGYVFKVSDGELLDRMIFALRVYAGDFAAQKTSADALVDVRPTVMNYMDSMRANDEKTDAQKLIERQRKKQNAKGNHD